MERPEERSSALAARFQVSPTLLAVVLVGAVVLVYWPSAASLFRVWTDTVTRSFTHGLLMLALAVWLVLRERRAIDAVATSNLPLAFAVILASLAWVIAWRAALQDAHVLLLLGIVFLCVVATLGWGVGRLVLPAFALVGTVMPVWASLSDPLRDLTVATVDVLLAATGVPAYIEGDFVHLPNGTFHVEEGCSGMHFFVASLSMGVLYGAAARYPWRRGLASLAGLVALSIVANWIRVYAVVVAGYLTDMTSYLVTVDHYWLGWGIYVAVAATFVFSMARLAPKPAPRPVESAPDRRSQVRAQPVGHAMVVMIAAALVPAAGYGVLAAQVRVAGSVQIDWPRSGGTWRGPFAIEATAWQPRFPGASAEQMVRYIAADGTPIDVYVAAYRVQSQDAKSVGFFSTLVPEEGTLDVVSEASVRAGWREFRVRDPSGRESLLRSQYRVGTRAFASGRASQLWYGLGFVGPLRPSSVLGVLTECTPDCAAASRRLDEHAGIIGPMVRLAPAAQDGGEPT